MPTNEKYYTDIVNYTMSATRRKNPDIGFGTDDVIYTNEDCGNCFNFQWYLIEQRLEHCFDEDGCVNSYTGSYEVAFNNLT